MVKHLVWPALPASVSPTQSRIHRCGEDGREMRYRVEYPTQGSRTRRYVAPPFILALQVQRLCSVPQLHRMDENDIIRKEDEEEGGRHRASPIGWRKAFRKVVLDFPAPLLNS